MQSVRAARSAATINPQALPDTLDVERWWGVVFFALAACEPQPKGPVQVVQPETMRFETEQIRREMEHYKEAPSAETRRRMENAFAALDARVQGLEALAQNQSGDERILTELQIADLKHRRDLNWTRAQTALVETQTVKRAEPVAERVVKAERANSSTQRERRARTQALRRAPMEARQPSPNFFQRLFR